MDEDLLGSFFSDIKKVEKEVNHSLNEDDKRDSADPPFKKARTVMVEETIVSKPSASSQKVEEDIRPMGPPSITTSSMSTGPSPVVTSTTTISSSSSGSKSDDLMSFLKRKVKPALNTTASAAANTNKMQVLATPISRSAEVVNQNMDGVKTQANKTFVRVAGGETWRDDTLKDWPENDFRLFIGDLSKDVKEKDLEKVFAEYKSYAMCRIAYTRFGGRVEAQSKGYGFVSFLDPLEAAKAMREKQGKYIGPRPIHITRADWRQRDAKEVKKKAKKKAQMRAELGL